MTAQANTAQVHHLLSLLDASLSPDAGTRQAAEAALDQAAAAPGFGLALVAVLLAAGGEVPLGLRQLAATVLKKLVREHWTEESPHYKGPPVAAEEKEAIKEQLPAGLGDESSKVRTAVAMAVAGIAKWDCPQAWPGLIPGLVQAITAKKNANLGEQMWGCGNTHVSSPWDGMCRAAGQRRQPTPNRLAGSKCAACRRPASLHALLSLVHFGSGIRVLKC